MTCKERHSFDDVMEIPSMDAVHLWSQLVGAGPRERRQSSAEGHTKWWTRKIDLLSCIGSQLKTKHRLKVLFMTSQRNSFVPLTEDEKGRRDGDRER